MQLPLFIELTPGKNGGRKNQRTQGKRCAAYSIKQTGIPGRNGTGIAHEINQPLDVIKMTTTGMLHFLKKGKILPDGMLKEELTTTNSQIERMRKIIDHLRSFSRKSSEIVTEEVDINIPLNAGYERN